jgi:hypothetical protein
MPQRIVGVGLPLLFDKEAFRNLDEIDGADIR